MTTLKTNSKTFSNTGVQKFGSFLSGMVLPNIGAFIAWGLITSLFIPTGWIPNENLATVIGPMITYLLPLLIAYTGGKMVYDTRGGVLAAIATMGVIVGTSIPMFLGAMIMGPLAAWIIKKFDGLVQDIIPTGFEMLVNNFSAGILGGALTLFAYLGFGPLVEAGSNALGSGVEAIVNAGLLPLASIFVEPAKVLFLNNAINHGVFTPLGIEQVATAGKSIFFLIETNPGPGLGILLSYWVFSKGMIKQSAPGAIIIHFFGGIHEIYFPYILMQPSLILAAIAGGATGVLTFVITKAGLVASPSPGSIFALIAMAPKGELFKVLLGVLLSTIVTFLIAAVLIKKKGSDEDEFADAKDKMIDLKGKESKVVTSSRKSTSIENIEDLLSEVKVIAVACDAGMGSSAMGASKLKSAFKDNHIDIKVINCSIDQLDDYVNLVITHEKLSARAKEQAPTAIHLTIKDFVNTNIYEKLATKIKEQQELYHTVVEEEKPMRKLETLNIKNIRIGQKADTKEEAIRMAGQILYEGGYVEEGYIDAMVQRDSELSTFIGNGTAIPHGVSDAKKKIKQTGLSVLQFPEGVDFNGNKVYLVVGIAGIGNEHLMILSNLAEIIEDEEKVEVLSKTTDVDYIYRQFTN